MFYKSVLQQSSINQSCNRKPSALIMSFKALIMSLKALIITPIVDRYNKKQVLFLILIVLIWSFLYVRISRNIFAKTISSNSFKCAH